MGKRGEMEGERVELSELLSFVANNGFSIVVAMYSLTRLENTMKQNTKVMEQVLMQLRGVSYE